MSSPTVHTIKTFQDAGWVVQTVERWIPQAKKRIDLLGFIDLLAFKLGYVIAIQTTSTSNISSRQSKILSKPLRKNLRLWLSVPQHYIHVWGWSKKGPARSRKLWMPVVRDIAFVDRLPLVTDITAGIVDVLNQSKPVLKQE